tara:strand:+ start:5206 stop:6138 length:933 start_codon:yes stop_codon:yes gene_type:complete
MEFEIVLKDEVYDEVYTLMRNIKTLNDGDEIGGWFLGDWKFTNEKAELLLDEFIIPKQEVSGAEVNIEEDSMLDTIKEIGTDKCNRIKAHWHIHPFGNGDTNWSSTDEEKIRDFMNPEKEREIFVFLLSSEDRMKARVELNIRGTIKKQTICVRKSLDNLDVRKDSRELVSPYFEKLKKRIEEKVERRAYSTVYNAHQWKDTTGTDITDSMFEPQFTVNINRDGVYVVMYDDFAEYITCHDLASEELKTPTNIKEKPNGKVSWFFEVKQKKNRKAVKKMLSEELADIQAEFEEIMTDDGQTQYTSYGYSY